MLCSFQILPDFTTTTETILTTSQVLGTTTEITTDFTTTTETTQTTSQVLGTTTEITPTASPADSTLTETEPQTTEPTQSKTTIQSFIEQMTSSGNAAVLHSLLSLCPCLANNTATAEPLDPSSLAQWVEEMKEDLLVDKKSVSRFRRAMGSEGDSDVALFVLLGVGVFMLVNIAWIVCNRWRYGLKSVSSQSQPEKS